MIDVDIGLSKILKNCPRAFEVRTIDGDERVMAAVWFLFDKLAPFKLFEGGRQAVCQDHLHRFARIA